MFKGIINTDEATPANINLAFSVARNTNPNTRYDASTNEVVFNASGYYNVMANIVASSSGTTAVSAQLFGNGVAQDGITSTVLPVATGDPMSFTLIDTIKVEPSTDTEKARISVRLSAGATINDAVLLVEKVR